MRDEGAESVVLDKIADALVEQFGLPFVAIYVTAGEMLHLAASRGYAAPVQSLPVGDTTIQRVAGARSGLLVPTFSVELGSAPIRTELSLPVFAGGELAALLNVGSPTDAPIGELDRAAISAIAGRLTAALGLRWERDEGRRRRLVRVNAGAAPADGTSQLELLVRQTVALLRCAPGIVGTAVRFGPATPDLSIGDPPPAVPVELQAACPVVRLPDDSLVFVLAAPVGADPGILARFLPDHGPDSDGLIVAETPVRPDDEPSTVIAALDAAFAMAQRAASVGAL